ncbi:MAG: hypothetical protein SFY66_02025 [Oculatellaceae cyanobacterium bins.114]|nr:hypothetical protein [Oculatellaceae cyanobacterium bins.114]
MSRKLSCWMVLVGSTIAITLINTSQGAIASEVTPVEVTLPPASDLPEEVARTQIILEARSPIDGRPLSAAEYAELQTRLENRDRVPLLRPEIRQIIFLLEFRRGIYDLFPFLPE